MNGNKIQSIISSFTCIFIIFKSNVIFPLLQIFELFDKMAKIKTSKAILMNNSNVLLKTAIITKILFQISHGNPLKIGCSSFTII